MTLKNYLILMSFSALLCWGAFFYVLLSIDPYLTNWIGLLLFYITLFFALSGSFAVLGFLTRFVVLKKDLVFHSVKIAFRQSFLFAFLVIAIFWLQSQNLLTWLNLFFLAGGLILLEFFWLNYNRSKIKNI
ncbi:hypothetical protein K8R62_00965 [bacterium]|nr:hypothetical protein [bacterium]